MNGVGIRAKKKWCENYFLKHPDSRTIQIVGGGTFPALFDFAYMNNNMDSGNVEQQKRVPHITFFSEYAGALEARVTEIEVPSKFDEDGIAIATTAFTVYRISDDLTEETFQAEAWLI